MALILAAELAVRAMFSGYVTDDVYLTHRLQEKVYEFEDETRRGPVDVIFTGSSIVDRGVDTAVFERSCAARNVGIKAYNAGLEGATMQGLAPVVDRYFLRPSPAKLVYLCVSPRFVNKHQTASDTEGNQRLLTAARMSTTQERLLRLRHHFRLYANRRELKLWLAGKTTVGRTTGRPGGFLPVEGVISDDCLADRPDLVQFEPDAEYVDALIELCNAIQADGTKCVVVDMPLPRQTVQLLSDRQWDAYRRVIRRVTQLGVPVLRFDDDQFETRHFRDALHLNPEGAALLSELLARDTTRRLSEASTAIASR